MKQITLNFREVAVEGLPEEDGYYLVRRSEGYQPLSLPFSPRYNGFNLLDFYPDDHTRMDGVTHWIPLDEFNAAFKDGETP